MTKNEFLTHRFTWISKSAALGWCVPSSCPDINPNISSVIKLIWVVMCVPSSLSLSRSLLLAFHQYFLRESVCECECVCLIFISFMLGFYLFALRFFRSFVPSFAASQSWWMFYLRVFCWLLLLLVFVCCTLLLYGQNIPSVEIWLGTHRVSGMYLVYVITYSEK